MIVHFLRSPTCPACQLPGLLLGVPEISIFCFISMSCQNSCCFHFLLTCTPSSSLPAMLRDSSCPRTISLRHTPHRQHPSFCSGLGLLSPSCTPRMWSPLRGMQPSLTFLQSFFYPLVLLSTWGLFFWTVCVCVCVCVCVWVYEEKDKGPDWLLNLKS